MSKIRSTDTSPEKIVRSVLHKNGYRFRVHQQDLPGIPDIVLKKYRTVILVHGCYWHRHVKCKFAYNPKSRTEFWQKKFKRNIERDKEVKHQLNKLGWTVIIIWECETSNNLDLERKLIKLIPKQDRRRSNAVSGEIRLYSAST